MSEAVGTVPGTAAVTAAELARIRGAYPHLLRPRPKTRLMTAGLIAGLGLYIICAGWLLGFPQIFDGFNWTLTRAYFADFVSYNSLPKIQLDEGDLTVAWQANDPVGASGSASWLREDPAAGAVTVTFGAAGELTVVGGEVQVRCGEQIARILGGQTPPTIVEAGDAGDAADPHASCLVPEARKIVVQFGFPGHAEIKDDEVRVFRRFWGWENFLFDRDSKLNGMSGAELVGYVLTGPAERVDVRQRVTDPDTGRVRIEQVEEVWPAWRFALGEFLSNEEWRHGEVFLALMETFAMALIGTSLAAGLAAPLSFVAARNINPMRAAAWGTKRLFDLLRTLDLLIWSLVFIRAFGQGPLSGILAIGATDTGTFGKMYAEALENTDDKQREGVRSTGGRGSQVQRYGTLPQVLPVFLSQFLYYVESNTRSATIIGALGAGGIGLKLADAIRTRQHWEDVLYITILIIVVVILIDSASSWARQRLIRGRGR